MKTFKTQQEIENLKISCQILAEVKDIVYNKTKKGISGLELDHIAETEILKRYAQPAFKGYQGFKHSICISFNEELIHGIPSSRKIKDGDLVKIDIGCIYNSIYSDAAFSKGIGKIKDQDKILIQVAKSAFDNAVKTINNGAKQTGDISAAIWSVIKSYGLFVPANFSGHGIGYNLHQDPYIHNIGKAHTGSYLKDGMAICIEPMILQKSNRIKILKDGWTVVSKENLNTAHYEHTVLIENGKAKILTQGRKT